MVRADDRSCMQLRPSAICRVLDLGPIDVAQEVFVPIQKGGRARRVHPVGLEVLEFSGEQDGDGRSLA